MNSKGFTLIELLLVIALLVISVGVTGDIVLSLVKSYTKTQIGNEVEQNANFVTAKIEKELRNASSVVNVQPSQITFLDKNQTQVIYKVQSTGGFNQLYRNAGNGDVLLTDDDQVNGVKLGDCSVNDCFSQVNAVGTTPDVVKINLDFSQGGSATGVSSTGDILVQDTIVVRGSY